MTPGTADPAIYPKLRERALQIRVPNLPPGAVHACLMDWNVAAATATVMVAAEGTASIYLSSGGGFIGGSQKSQALRAAAIRVVKLAETLLPFTTPAETTPLPTPPDVFFYFVTAEGLRVASATDAELSAKTSPLTSLGAAMQGIVSAYRTITSFAKPSPPTQ